MYRMTDDKHIPKQQTPSTHSRPALASRVWAAGVREWMLTPRVETVKVPRFFGEGELETKEQWTGLPRTLHLDDTLTTADDAAALVTLLRAAAHPAPDVAARLKEAYKEDLIDEESRFMGMEPFARTHYLRFNAAKLKGLPDVTFVSR
jgi:hypothetical protein